MDLIEEFLGREATQELEENPKKVKYYHYESERLKYEIFVNYDDRIFSVSADFEYPFGFKSLVEVSVEFDNINIETEPEFYGDQKILVCRKDYPGEKNLKTIMIMKWENGELSIWPYRLESNVKK